MGEEHRMVISGVQALVPDLCDFVVASARRANLNDRAVYHCQMAVDEACTNIIEHGFAGAEEMGKIEVVCRDDADRFIMRIYDDGPPFDPVKRDDPNPSTPLAEREPGGWGIFFIKKMMDSVAYVMEDGRNCLTLAKLKSANNLAQELDTHSEMEDAALEIADGVWRITPPTRLDSNTSPGLQTLLDSQIEANRTVLIIDMAEVSYISTSGLKVFVNTWRQLQANAGQFALAGMITNVREVFETVGFDQFFAIHDTVEEALHHLANQKT